MPKLLIWATEVKPDELCWGMVLCLASHLHRSSAFLSALHNDREDSTGVCWFMDFGGLPGQSRLNSTAFLKRFLLIPELPGLDVKEDFSVHL